MCAFAPIFFFVRNDVYNGHYILTYKYFFFISVIYEFHMHQTCKHEQREKNSFLSAENDLKLINFISFCAV